MADLTPTLAGCVQRIRAILAASRSKALRSVNAAMLTAYWEIGREIVEEEQRGKALTKRISQEMSTEFGKGFGVRNVRYFRQFYLCFRDRAPPGHQIGTSLVPISAPTQQLNAELSWSHYRVLMRQKDPTIRRFYEINSRKSSHAHGTPPPL